MTDLVKLALDIRRGSIRLEDIPLADRPVVVRVLHSMTDAQAGLIAAGAEGRRRNLGRTGVRQRYAGS